MALVWTNISNSRKLGQTNVFSSIGVKSDVQRIYFFAWILATVVSMV